LESGTVCVTWQKGDLSGTTTSNDRLASEDVLKVVQDLVDDVMFQAIHAHDIHSRKSATPPVQESRNNRAATPNRGLLASVQKDVNAVTTLVKGCKGLKCTTTAYYNVDTHFTVMKLCAKTKKKPDAAIVRYVLVGPQEEIRGPPGVLPRVGGEVRIFGFYTNKQTKKQKNKCTALLHP